MKVARRKSPPDWFDVQPQGTIHPAVSPETINVTGCPATSPVEGWVSMVFSPRRVRALQRTPAVAAMASATSPTKAGRIEARLAGTEPEFMADRDGLQ
jgi:hypothetical protein